MSQMHAKKMERGQLVREFFQRDNIPNFIPVPKNVFICP
jgi:hypothetical protein